MKNTLKSKRLKRSIEEALMGLSMSSGDQRNQPFAIAEVEALYGPIFQLEEDSSKKVYVVYYGRRMGVFQTWSACSSQVIGFSKSRFEGFKHLSTARKAWRASLMNGTWGNGHFYIDEPNIPLENFHVLHDDVIPEYVGHNIEPLVVLFTPNSSHSPLPSSSLATSSKASRTSNMHQRPPLASGPPMAPTPTPSRTSRPANPSTRTASDQGTSNSFSTVSSITPSTPSTPKDKGKGRHPAKSAISMLHYLKLRKPHLAEPGDYLTNEILDSHLVGFEDAWFVVSQGSYPGIYYGRSEARLGMGDTPAGRVHVFPDLEQAEGFFSYAFMNNMLVEYDRNGVPYNIGCRLSRQAHG